MKPTTLAHDQPALWRHAVLAFCVLHALQAAFLYWVASNAVSCCDTAYYSGEAVKLMGGGFDALLDAASGYRSYFVPLIVGLVLKLPFADWMTLPSVLDHPFMTPEASGYPFNMSVVFVAVTAIVGWRVLRRAGFARWLGLASATTLNPFVLAHVPYSLQESVLVLFLTPMLLVLLGHTHLRTQTRIVLIIALAALAYIIRSALAWIVIPAAAYCVLVAIDARRRGEPRRPWRIAAISFAAIVVPLFAPQMYASKLKHDSWMPYPYTEVFSLQINWGIDMLKYATVKDRGGWRALPYRTPFANQDVPEKSLRYYVDHPTRGLVLALSHVYAGFHYDVPTPYWVVVRPPLLTLSLLLSSAIVFLGLYGVVTACFSRPVSAETVFLTLALLLCAGSLVPMAVESRFGLVGFIVLSIKCADTIRTADRATWRWLAPGLVLYLIFSVLVNALLTARSDIPL